jgi:hypothetical protein
LLWSEKRVQPDLTVADTSNGFPLLLQRKHPLNAIVFDFSSIAFVDATGLQVLIDARSDADRWAGQPVPFYFAHVKPTARKTVEYFLSLDKKERGAIPLDTSASNPSPDVHTCFIPELSHEKDSIDFSSETTTYIFSTIDDAVGAAAQPFKFGSLSTVTI